MSPIFSVNIEIVWILKLKNVDLVEYVSKITMD